jgi:hypothetical protein
MFLKLIILISIELFVINSIYSSVDNDLCNIKINVENIENKTGNYLVLVNAKKQLLLNDIRATPEGKLDLNLPISAVYTNEGNHSIAVYSSDSGQSLVHLQELYLTSKVRNKCINQVNDHIRHKRFSPSGHSIGLQYSVWQTFASSAQHKILSNGGKPQTMEQIIQRGGAISDYFTHNVTEKDSDRFYYMVEPKNG